MAATPAAPPGQSQLVTGRRRRYVVTDVTRSALDLGPLRPTGHGPQHLVCLASIEDDALGEELQVFWGLGTGDWGRGPGSWKWSLSPKQTASTIPSGSTPSSV